MGDTINFSPNGELKIHIKPNNIFSQKDKTGYSLIKFILERMEPY